MIPDAIISCSYVVLGSGHGVYRLFVKYSNNSSSNVFPQFLIASAGLMAIAARSVHALFYNMLWRTYPIDPMLIAKELKEDENDENFIDWILSKGGTASLVYSLYYHYNFAATGAVIVIALTVFEILCLTKEIASSKLASSDPRVSNAERQIAAFVDSLPFPPATFWMLSMELLGLLTRIFTERAIGNPFCRLANVPYAISIWAFPRKGFYTGWSINHTINDYIMLSHVLVITEALHQVPIN